MNIIHFYIILKLLLSVLYLRCVWILYVFISFSNHREEELKWLTVWILYVFTSFSNVVFQLLIPCQFEYYTFLHHSQTEIQPGAPAGWFEYYTFLHHSQTELTVLSAEQTFEYYTFLHHSQTIPEYFVTIQEFEYYTFLHHSQTLIWTSTLISSFEYYTFLHHSQTGSVNISASVSLNTIRFYIILKQKRNRELFWIVWILYVFTSFSNRIGETKTMVLVWILYVFTSFSNP